jgi:ferredoxin
VTALVRVSVDQRRCCGSGVCAAIAPELFDQSTDDGVVVLLRETADESELPRLEEAAQLCPVAAIGVLRS